MIACDFSRHACYILSWFPFFCVYLSPLPCPSSPFPFPQFSPLHPAVSLSIAPPTPYPGGGSILLSWFLSYTRICTPLLKTGSWQPQRARTAWVHLSGAPWPHSTWSFLSSSISLPPDFIIFHSCIEVQSIYVPFFGPPFVSWRAFRSFSSPGSCEESSNEHGWTSAYGVGHWALWAYAKAWDERIKHGFSFSSEFCTGIFIVAALVCNSIDSDWGFPFPHILSLLCAVSCFVALCPSDWDLRAVWIFISPIVRYSGSPLRYFLATFCSFGNCLLFNVLFFFEFGYLDIFWILIFFQVHS